MPGRLNLDNLNSPFSRLSIIYVFWIISWIFAGSLFEVYFFNLGMSVHDIVGSSIFWFLGSLIIAPFFGRVDARKFMLFGIFLGMVSVGVLYAIKSVEAAVIYRLILGLTHIFFWLPFNIMFYEFRKENNAVMGSFYYSVGPLLMLMLPGIGGYIAGSLGFGTLYALALACYALTFILAFFSISTKEYKYELLGTLRSMSGLKTIIFIEGFAAAIIVSVLLEAMLLSYFRDPAGFGAFISATTAFAIAASFLTSKFSDMRKRRREFLILSAALLGASAIFTSISSDIAMFFAGFAAVNFFKTVFFPLPLALAVDNSKDLVATMMGREYMLNFGRLAGAMLAYAMMFYFELNSVLFVFGMILLIACPLIFEIKKKKLEKI